MNCDWLAQFNRELINRRLERTHAIISCSEYIANRIRSRFPHHASRCVTIYNGVDMAELSRQANQVSEGRGKRFIYVGRVSPEKGIHILLQAFKMVLAREPEAELKIIGGAHIPPLPFIVDLSTDPAIRSLREFYTSDYLEYLHNKAKEMPANRVLFAGFVTHNELSLLLHPGDVFVQPVVWDEPFGMPVVEAMAAGLPVVSSRSGGLSEIVVDGTTGLLVTPNDPAALAEAMVELLSNEHMARSMGAAGQVRARLLFSWETVTARLYSLYKALVSGLPITNLQTTL